MPFVLMYLIIDIIKGIYYRSSIVDTLDIMLIEDFKKQRPYGLAIT